MEIYILQFFISILNIFLKGMQTQWVTGGHKVMAAVTSVAMSVFVPISVLMVVEGGWLVIFPTALGSAVGISLSIIVYQRHVKEKPNG